MPLSYTQSERTHEPHVPLGRALQRAGHLVGPLVLDRVVADHAARTHVGDSLQAHGPLVLPPGRPRAGRTVADLGHPAIKRGPTQETSTHLAPGEVSQGIVGALTGIYHANGCASLTIPQTPHGNCTPGWCGSPNRPYWWMWLGIFPMFRLESCCSSTRSDASACRSRTTSRLNLSSVHSVALYGWPMPQVTTGAPPKGLLSTSGKIGLAKRSTMERPTRATTAITSRRCSARKPRSPARTSGSPPSPRCPAAGA